MRSFHCGVVIFCLTKHAIGLHIPRQTTTPPVTQIRRATATAAALEQRDCPGAYPNDFSLVPGCLSFLDLPVVPVTETSDVTVPLELFTRTVEAPPPFCENVEPGEGSGGQSGGVYTVTGSGCEDDFLLPSQKVVYVVLPAPTTFFPLPPEETGTTVTEDVTITS